MPEANPPDTDDPEWIRAARGGNLAAFSRLELRHQWVVRAFLLARLSRKHEAGDLAAAELLSVPRGRPGATRVAGRFGRALSSAGIDDYVESGFAVVMDGGASPSTATHVLRYVDGRQERTTRKSVRVINTEPATEPHGVWLGRNLSVTDAVPDNAFFFRGVLDEVQIFADALDLPMIRRVTAGGPPAP